MDDEGEPIEKADDEQQEDNASEFNVEDALKMYERYKSHWEENYREASIDLKMASGDRATQWGEGWADDAVKKQVAGKPRVVINELPQYIHQVTNDIRQNTPSIKVIPEADGDEETAEIESGLIRAIEYKSGADEAYDTAAEYAVKCSIGFIRVDHDYVDDDIDTQELFICNVPDPLSIYLDPASVDSDGRDANGVIALEPINKEDFNRLYKGKSFVSFAEPENKDAQESIVLANIYIRRWGGARGKTATICAYKFSGEELLVEETTFPGDYVPYVPVYGEMTWIDGQRKLSSLIRNARDPQRRVNHMASKESEMLAMAPIAPVMAVRGTLANERGQWQNPGKETVLEYDQKDVNGDPAPPPQRLNPPSASQAFLEAIASAKEDIKESMGIYNAGLGKREGDASGVALQALDRTGDIATFHFPDNVRRSITQVGRILVSAIPSIYDTPRVIQIVNEETDVRMVGVNGAPSQPDQKQAYDLTKGKYHVRVTTGASYTTRRQEAAKLYGDVIKANPQLLNVIGDLWARNLDVAGAEAIAARFKKMVPPQLQDDSTDPQVQALQGELQKAQQLIQQGAQALQQMKTELDSKQADVQIKQAELQVKQQELQVRGIEGQVKLGQLQQPQITNDNSPDPFEQEIAARELAVKEYDAETKRLQVTTKIQPDPLGIKLDTSGFQIMKTPEQLAMESQQSDFQQQQSLLQTQQEDQERQDKQAQTAAILQGIDIIAKQLNQLTMQVAAPKNVVRDENGVIQGVK